MMEFTKDNISAWRIWGEPPGYVEESLDEIKRLQQRITEVEDNREHIEILLCKAEKRIAELEQERRWIYQDKTMIVKKDGDSWCAVLPDFKDLQQSESRWFSGDINKYMDDVYWYLKRQTTPTPEGGNNEREIRLPETFRKYV